MVLVLGGTKSGKSSFASRRAAEREHLGPVAYLATARADDGEMADRIRRHRADRPDHWITVEEPLDTAGYFERLAADPAEDGPATVLLDCITLWLTNILAPFGEEPDREKALVTGGRETKKLAAAISAWESAATDRQVLVVSNLVEVGLISPWPLGRIFQDLAGLTHQALAETADEVYLMTAGLPGKIK